MEGSKGTSVPVPEVDNRQYDNNVLNANTNKTIVPEIMVEDETHLLHGNTTNMPITPDRSRAVTPDPLEGFTPEELEITARVMRAMSKKRKEAELTAGGMRDEVPTKPLIVNLESQFNQAGQQQPSRSRGRETTPAERQLTQGAQVGDSGSYRHEVSSGLERRAVRAIIRPRISPFTQEVLDQQMEKIKMSSCTYDGKGDPKRYVAAFESHMLLYTDTDAVWCKVFPTTLTGAASDWFSNLESGSIDCFETLVELFTGQYISNSARQRTSGELMAI